MTPRLTDRQISDKLLAVGETKTMTWRKIVQDVLRATDFDGTRTVAYLVEMLQLEDDVAEILDFLEEGFVRSIQTPGTCALKVGEIAADMEEVELALTMFQPDGSVGLNILLVEMLR